MVYVAQILSAWESRDSSWFNSIQIQRAGIRLITPLSKRLDVFSRWSQLMHDTKKSYNTANKSPTHYFYKTKKLVWLFTSVLLV